VGLALVAVLGNPMGTLGLRHELLFLTDWFLSVSCCWVAKFYSDYYRLPDCKPEFGAD